MSSPSSPDLSVSVPVPKPRARYRRAGYSLSLPNRPTEPILPNQLSLDSSVTTGPILPNQLSSDRELTCEAPVSASSPGIPSTDSPAVAELNRSIHGPTGEPSGGPTVDPAIEQTLQTDRSTSRSTGDDVINPTSPPPTNPLSSPGLYPILSPGLYPILSPGFENTSTSVPDSRPVGGASCSRPPGRQSLPGEEEGPTDPSPPSSPAPDPADPGPYVAAPTANWGEEGEGGSGSCSDDEAPPPATAPSPSPPPPSCPPPPLSPTPATADGGDGGSQPDISSGAPQNVTPVLGLAPCREAPGPPQRRGHVKARPVKPKTPRAATIRVSRKRQGGGAGGVAGGGAQPAADPARKESVVSRSSWLDVWKGRKHNVVWANLDGQLMSLWKKRTDKFTDVVFHVSSITNVVKQDKDRFKVYFRKKHFDFMAHNSAVQEGWVASLLASRGRAPPAPPKQHGPLTMKDPRSRVYAAAYEHRLWIYHNKEDFQLGVGMTYVSMNVATLKRTGRRSFSLITPYKTFSFSADSSRELEAWLGFLEEVIRSALSCSEVALRLWSSPWNKVCADCGAANPEWASVNLLAVVCEACAGQHRALGISLSKVRSLKLDSKVWTEPLIQLFVVYGNQASREVWGHSVPAAEQILTDCPADRRSQFITAKYARGRYRRVHPLASSQRLLNQRLCEVVCGDDVPETLSLLCSGAKVLCHSGDPQCPTPLALAERAGRALQIELLRHNEYTEYPANHQDKPDGEPAPSDPSSGSGEEELHGKLEEDRFLFSYENDSATCDVLDLREVISVFDCSTGSSHEFEIVTLTDKLLCSAATHEELGAHLTYILKVVLPGPVEEAELRGLSALSRVSLREGAGLQHAEVWAALHRGGVTFYPAHPIPPQQPSERLALDPDARYKLDLSEAKLELVAGGRSICLQFEEQHSCESWQGLLVWASAPPQRGRPPSLYPLPSGKVPPAVERCISHITLHGLKVDGLYRRCGMATKVSRLVEALCVSAGSAPLESDEQGVLDAASALKQYVRQRVELIPPQHRELWGKAAAEPVEAVRLASYRTLLGKLPPDNRVTLSAMCGHFYIVQLYSGENRMTAHNLALVFVPTLFQDLAMNTSLVQLTRELIIHHTLLFTRAEGEPVTDREEQITFF